jgi:hypothetical protein
VTCEWVLTKMFSKENGTLLPGQHERCPRTARQTCRRRNLKDGEGTYAAYVRNVGRHALVGTLQGESPRVYAVKAMRSRARLGMAKAQAGMESRRRYD